MDLDVNRIATTALQALLDGDAQSENGRAPEPKRHALGTVGAMGLGLALAAGARMAYVKARNLDIEQFAEAVEDRLKS